MKLWLDDIRQAPEGYIWCKSVNEAKYCVIKSKEPDKNCHIFENIELIDIDHDAGDYAADGGDFIKFLDWLEEQGLNYPIRIHSMNPVGVDNMRRIIQRNGWTEIF